MTRHIPAPPAPVRVITHATFRQRVGRPDALTWERLFDGDPQLVLGALVHVIAGDSEREHYEVTTIERVLKLSYDGDTLVIFYTLQECAPPHGEDIEQ